MAARAAVVVVIAMAAVSYFASRRAPVQGEPDTAPLDVGVPAPSFDGESRAVAGDTESAEAAAREVRAASATFRNGTFLIAIRRAGFYCDDVTLAYESADGVWVASCMDKGGYLVAVRDANEFDVRPVPHYVDGLSPVVIEDHQIQKEFVPPFPRLDQQFAPPSPDRRR